MFGEKSKKVAEQALEIENLRQQLADADVKAHPHLALARQIDRDVYYLVTEKAIDVDSALTMAIDNAHGTSLQNRLDAYLAGVPTLDVLRAFDERIGHDEVNKLLARRALREYRQIERSERMESMQKDALQLRKIDLMQLPIGSLIEVGLFYREDADKQSHDNADITAEIILGRTDNPDKPNLVTILDRYSKHKLPNEFFVRNGSVELGSMIVDENQESRFVPEFTHGQRPAFRFGEKIQPSYYDVGYVKVDDTIVLDSPDAMRLQENS